MRGQDSGSEHERQSEGSGAPAMPPPSFGQAHSSVPQPEQTKADQTTSGTSTWFQDPTPNGPAQPPWSPTSPPPATATP
ncbi:hypothetical protein ABGB17_07970, partial [Sphaerisporangium sp. B11E5]|uniref:hypothetical protein n=1 Tax=Sphaerisporangium sp. B11E5 TaxID=3153563 RepID=UPI00325C9084